MLRVSLQVEHDGGSWSAETAVVNRWGAMVLSPIACVEGSVLQVANAETGQTARFLVMWCGGEDFPGRYKLGLEIIDERPSFWGPRYENLTAAPPRPPDESPAP